MAEENGVILIGFLNSPYVKRAELALKIKGIQFEYKIEKSLLEKSELLLKYNPVTKKVPVLVHNGEPIVESLVVLEYIDETWKREPRFLPNDPLERARVRFWARYYEQIVSSVGNIINELPKGEEAREKARQEMVKKLDVLEQNMNNSILGNRGTINDSKNMDILDIMIAGSIGAFKAQGEVAEIKIVDPEKHPLISQWFAAIEELPVVKQNLPNHENLVAGLRGIPGTGYKLPTN